MIPRIVVQTAESRDLPDEIVEARCAMIDGNPEWKFVLFDAKDREDFIQNAFGTQMLETYCSIDSHYGAARADIFRYLYIYKNGGVYIDVKSCFYRPISEVIGSEDDFILSQWRNGDNEEFESFGLHRELQHIPRGEFQQWHVIARPNHPFLEAVINVVVRNIKTYNVWTHGLGRIGVQRVTGPIAYTLAINPLRSAVCYRQISSEQDIGLRFSVLVGKGMGKHYSEIKRPIVQTKYLNSASVSAYNFARMIKNKLRK